MADAQAAEKRCGVTAKREAPLFHLEGDPKASQADRGTMQTLLDGSRGGGDAHLQTPQTPPA